MNILFIFAHPDDETVACAGTIHQLGLAGHRVFVVSATNGGAGEFPKELGAEVEKLGSVGALRTQEFSSACAHLGVTESKILGFSDGEITNKLVWSELMSEIKAVMDQYKPEVVVTFDHSGWYYHLDHVGVSIATTSAFHENEFSRALFFSTFQPKQERWNYAFPDPSLTTHSVEVVDVDHKLQAVNLHKTQNLEVVTQHILSESPHFETYHLGFLKPKYVLPVELRQVFKPK